MELSERSLWHFCKHLNIDLENLNENITSIKKQIQLEFKAANNGIIQIDGLDYDSNFIANELENSNVKSIVQYDNIIKNIPWLYDFIYKSRFTFSEDITNRNYTLDIFLKEYSIPIKYDTVEFRAYLSPKIAKSFDNISRKLLEDDLFFKQKILMGLLEYIDPNDFEQAFQYIRLMLNDAIKIIRNSNKSNYLNKGNDLERWSINSAGNFINSLPESLHSIKIRFVHAMTNFLVDIQQENLKFTYKLSFQLVCIKDLPHELAEIVTKNHFVYKQKYEGVEKYQQGHESKSFSTKQIIYLVLYLLFLLSRC